MGGASPSLRSSARRLRPCGVLRCDRCVCSESQSEGEWKGGVEDAGLAGRAMSCRSVGGGSKEPVGRLCAPLPLDQVIYLSLVSFLPTPAHVIDREDKAHQGLCAELGVEKQRCQGATW